MTGSRIKKLLLPFFLFIIFALNLYGSDLYDISRINKIEIFFKEDNWDEILDDLYWQKEEERLTGTVYINGMKFDSAGIRYKGNITYNSERLKNPLNIKLDHIISGQLLDGYGTIKLSNGYKDPTFVREVLGYEIARKYMPASHANYANVYINGEYFGLYTSVQSVDKFFCKTHFGSKDNAFFKGVSFVFNPWAYDIWGYYGKDTTEYKKLFELKSDKGWGDLIEFMDTLNNHSDKIGEVYNVDSHLWMLAFDILLANLDSPINFPHNFYLYKDGSGRFNPVIWDLNESFGGFRSVLDENNLDDKGLQQMDPFFNSKKDRTPIVKKFLTNGRFRKMYVAHFKTIIEENFSNGWYKQRINELQDLIRNDVLNDKNKLFTDQDFTDNIGQNVPFKESSIIGITRLMDERIKYIATNIEFKQKQPVINDIYHKPAEPEPNSDIDITVDVIDADYVMIGYRYNPFGPFEKLEMFDDGGHGDGAADDGRFGVTIPGGTVELQYYFYAENHSAGAFSPARAEFEYHTLEIEKEVSTGIVINELLASNNNIIGDQDGDYDDWAELYNNSDDEISLKGYYLSDDRAKPRKWKFPHISIGPKDFLMVWVDDDEEQKGLHASFKISASGETLLLSNPDGKIIDIVDFGPQKTDISYGRYPNGTGNFEFMKPSFGKANDNILSADLSGSDNNFIFEAGIYPNPIDEYSMISFRVDSPSVLSVCVYDIFGRVVKKLTDQKYYPSGKHMMIINRKGLTPGIYYINIFNGGNSTYLKALVK